MPAIVRNTLKIIIVRSLGLKNLEIDESIIGINGCGSCAKPLTGISSPFRYLF